MPQTTDISGIPINKIGHGLMTMTWPNPRSEEQCFESIKAGIDVLPPGVKAFLNTGEFYGVPPNTVANLELLNRFFIKYPGYIDRTFLSVKGGMIYEHGLKPDASPAGLERSIHNSIEKLGANKIDLFQPARIDPAVPVEDMMATLNKYVESGKIGSIGLSECSAATLERATKVAKVAAVEIEVSPWSYEEETRKVIAKAAEIGAVVAAYSPLGQGFLTGKINLAELDESNPRHSYPRLVGEAGKSNQKLADALKTIAEKKGITPAQLCLAWVSSLGPHVVPIPGSTRKDRTLENLAATSIVLSEKELQDISRALEQNPVKGTRYPEQMMGLAWS